MYDDGDDMDKLCAMDPFLFRINFSKRELVAGVIDAYANVIMMNMNMNMNMDMDMDMDMGMNNGVPRSSLATLPTVQSDANHVQSEANHLRVQSEERSMTPQLQDEIIDNMNPLGLGTQEDILKEEYSSCVLKCDMLASDLEVSAAVLEDIAATQDFHAAKAELKDIEGLQEQYNKNKFDATGPLHQHQRHGRTEIIFRRPPSPTINKMEDLWIPNNMEGPPLSISSRILLPASAHWTRPKYAIFHVEFGGDILQAQYSEGGGDVRCP
ncbi:hypothetical protein PGB90_004396 [Kerria lacca]